MGKVNRRLGKEHQIIRSLDEKRDISVGTNISNVTEKTPHVIPTAPDADGGRAAGGLLSPSTRRSYSAERPEIIHTHSYHEGVYGKHETHGKDRKKSPEKAAIFHEFTFEGINPKSHEVAEDRKPKGSQALKPVKAMEVLERHQEFDGHLNKEKKKPAAIGEGTYAIPKGEEHPSVAHPVSPATPTFHKGFVHEMARKLEQTLAEETAKKPTPGQSPKIKPMDRSWQKAHDTSIGSGVIPSGFQLSKGSADVPKLSVHEAVRTFEQATSHQQSHEQQVHVVEASNDFKESKRQRMVSIGTPESINLEEIDLPRWSPNHNNGSVTTTSGVALPSG
ncbi:hypothetical protein GCK32_006360 [Trichostrongylus colubriformis]|uniref:Uncharacterized protein n=1 Tax=Trichostrongylus colubriformis TaxID=6319 RepID=A0AAN8F0X3_TRICO